MLDSGPGSSSCVCDVPAPAPPEPPPAPAYIVGRSAAIRHVLDLIDRVAPTDATVAILGETGTGKELVAQAIYERSRRRGRPFVKVNCAAIPASLIESELFGHERGAFTGASRQRAGCFEQANGGTILLDEIGDLPLELQAKLLRVVDEGELQRLGGSRWTSVDVRIIAATNRDLEAAVRDGRFRADLFYRLSAFPIRLPPLRERAGDIPLLAGGFLERFARRLGRPIDAIAPAAIEALAAHSWPGNVRELENAIERAAILTRGHILDLPEPLSRSGATLAPGGAAPGASAARTLAEVERDHVLDTLARTGWRVSGDRGAAKILGLKPTTLEARMTKLGSARPRACEAEKKMMPGPRLASSRLPAPRKTNNSSPLSCWACAASASATIPARCPTASFFLSL